MIRSLMRLVLLLVITDLLCVTQAIKYTLTTASNEELNFDTDVITSEDDAKRITIKDEFHVFDDDMLEIKEKTDKFIMDKNHVLHKLECGAFVDQELTETILISNTQIKVIPKGAFKNLKIIELILKDNEIRTIEEEAITELPNIETINLANNQIVKFFENSFVEAPALFIDMAYNQLKEIGENWFSFLNDGKKVTVLLDNNEIETVDSAAFDGVKLGTLNLKNNKIEELPSEIFEDNTLIRIYLQDNRLESLPDSFFKLKHLSLAVLSGNPFDSDVRKKLKQLDEDTSATITFDHQC